MKILVITQYYPPEPGAPSNRLLAFVDAMHKRGHQVTVICEFPNYPDGKLQPGDKWRLFRVENKGNHRIIRTFVLTFAKKNNIKRMIFYLSFAFSSFITALFLKRHDIIFTSSPPIFHAFTAMLAAKIKKSNYVLDIRDVWPESALEVEAVSNPRLLRWGGYVEQKIYHSAVLIITTTKGFKNHIESLGGDGKTAICYNGSIEEILNWTGDVTSLRKSKGWSKKILVTYAGLIGLGQNLIDVLPEVKNITNDELLFVFIGDGPQKNEFLEKIEELKLSNVLVFNMMPLQDVISFLYSSDILLITLRESEYFKTVIPSKFFDSMAAGKPIVSNVNGELREIMEEYNTGIYFSFADKGSFGKAITALYNDQARRNQMGNNGKKVVESKYLRSKLAAEAIKRVEKSVEPGID
ncbi:MAG: glycosyltransferase family 4 protein [candidate division Zixibacteria bacterium]|nr:glycosyltransferase family 4 protein [candidate division Zixibacteria bacterium]